MGNGEVSGPECFDKNYVLSHLRPAALFCVLACFLHIVFVHALSSVSSCSIDRFCGDRGPVDESYTPCKPPKEEKTKKTAPGGIRTQDLPYGRHDPYHWTTMALPWYFIPLNQKGVFPHQSYSASVPSASVPRPPCFLEGPKGEKTLFYGIRPLAPRG